MKIIDTHDPLGEAVAYAKASQHHGQCVVLSFARGMVICTHEGGHRRAFRQASETLVMHRLLADMSVDGFEQLATKRGGK